MSENIYIRIIIYILIMISIFNGWWFTAFPLLIVGTWIYSFGIEWLIAGVAYDSLFGMFDGSGWYGYIGTITGVFFIVISRLLGKMLRTY